MDNLNLLLKNLTGKDEKKAREAACYLVENSDVELFSLLVNKTDYLFDFVKNNVICRIQNAVTSKNYINILNFFDVYCDVYDDLFAMILAKNADEDLTDKIFQLLETGSTAQKSYAAKYFSYIPDTVAIELLAKYAFCEDDNLAFNSAEALGQMQDDVSFNIALAYLSSGDDFEKLKAVKFFVAYGKDFPLNEIFVALHSSNMPENIAGHIPYMISFVSEFESGYKKDILVSFDYIISGLGEILPLADIFRFEIYDFIELLINYNKKQNDFSSLISEILLKSYLKFKLFMENEEYVFDESNDVKHEVKAVYNLLTAQPADFWTLQKDLILNGLKSSSEDEVISCLEVISELNLKNSVPLIKELFSSENETVLCETLTVLKKFNELSMNDINAILPKIKNENIKAVIENLKN